MNIKLIGLVLLALTFLLIVSVVFAGESHYRRYEHSIEYTPTPTPTCKPSPTPTITVEDPTPTPIVTIEHAEAPKSAGDSGHVDTTGAPSDACVKEINPIPFLNVDQGVPNDSCVNVSWPLSPNGDRVNIIYGEYSRGFEHALRDFPDDGHTMICGLKNGVNYMFKIQAVTGYCSSKWSPVVDPQS